MSRLPTVKRLAPLSLLTAVLVACGMPESVTTPDGTTSDNASLVSLKLDAGTLKAAALRPQGVPFSDDGTSAVQVVHIEVYRDYFDGAPDRPLWFDDNGVEAPYGTGRGYIDLTPAASATTVRLRPGTYTLKAVGIPTYTDQTALAYQQVDNLTLSPAATAPTSVQLHLKTILGVVSFEPVLPVNYVIPGQTVDLKLVVQTPEIDGGRRFTVPVDDYTLFTGLGSESHGVEVLSSSQLGERVLITSPAPQDSEAFLLQKVQGLADASKVLATFRPTFSRPYYPALTLGVDLERPSLQVDPLLYRGTTQLNILTNDNVGVARVQVYDGVVLLGSTDDPTGGGFGGGTFGDLAFYADPTVEHDFTVIAIDTSGNETRTSLHVGISPPYTPQP